MRSFMKKFGLCAAFFSASILYTNPSNPTVVSGDVTFDSPTANTLKITSTSDRAIVDWENFSIELAELTQITLPQTTSAILNRVTSEAATSIKGLLSSNGQVYLINPNGILITPTGKIQVGQFVGSTLDVDNASFLAGVSMTFSGSSTAAITHMGQIVSNAGDSILIGYQIDSSAPIYAEQGNVSLGAGLQVILTPANDQRITIVPTAASVGGTGIASEDYITALRTELRADGNIYSMAINHTGYIVGAGQNGTPTSVIFEAAGGSTDCSGSIVAKNSDNTGGMVQVLGQTVDVSGTILAAGYNGGGTIYIGGSPMGTDPSILNADNTTVEPTARIYADAVLQGNGGAISVFANQMTICNGRTSSGGGVSSGNGGTIDIYGLQTLEFGGTANVRAYNGTDGTVTYYPPQDVVPPITGQ